jgi:hypothetical protein
MSDSDELCITGFRELLMESANLDEFSRNIKVSAGGSCLFLDHII